jgi:hypothetical protein
MNKFPLRSFFSKISSFRILAKMINWSLVSLTPVRILRLPHSLRICEKMCNYKITIIRVDFMKNIQEKKSHDTVLVRQRETLRLTLKRQIAGYTRARICKPFKEPRNRFPALAGRYDNPIYRTGPTGYKGRRDRFLGIDSWAPP